VDDDLPLLVRPAEDEDAALIAELTRQCWAGKVAPSSSGHRESAQQVAEQLRTGGAFLLLVDEVPVGSVRWMPADDDTDAWEVKRMGVLPQWRGHQLSQHLVEAVVHHALACGIGELRLAVRSDQPKLIDFYAAFGFELAEELEYLGANPAEPEPFVMRRWLR
jgi:GNAT superfamily N-acetyltransferase